MVLSEDLKNLNEEEQFALMVALLRDLRLDWGTDVIERANKVKDLATELGYERVLERVQLFLNSDCEDGRIFRTKFEDGGYEDVKTLLQDKKLNITHYSKISKNLILAVTKHCEQSEYLVGDFEEWYEDVENITVQLLDKDDNIKLTKHFTIGHEANAYAENWRMLNEGNHYRIFDEHYQMNNNWKALPLYECINCGARGMKEDDVEVDPTFWGNREVGYTCDHCGYVHYPNEGEFIIILGV